MALDVDHLTRAIGQFTLAQPSDATANNPSCTPAGTTNEADQTQSLLLSLPGEIRNQIFELVINQNTTIVLRAERIHMKNGKPGYRFHPKTPAFFATCRKLRAEFPMARYYATNSFVFSDNMFQTGAIAAFVEANKPAVEHMTHARVSHILNPYSARQHRSPSTVSCTTFRFNFDLTTLRSGAISVTDRNLNKNIDTRSGWLYNPCLCTLQSIATRAETQTLSNALSKYANAIERRIENEELYGDNGIACAVCGNARLF